MTDRDTIMKEDRVIWVENLSIGYGTTEADRRVIMQDLNFSIHRGEIFVILGGSGCGKSTLMRTLIGILPPFKGDVFIDGCNFSKAKGEEKLAIQRRFGVLYQSGALFSSMTLAENISLPLEEFTTMTPEERTHRIKECLQLVQLEGFDDYYPSEISGGMRKRAGLARALALKPEFVFFDEPSAGLDPISSAQLDALILDLREKLHTTMVIVTHELPSIFTVADRVIFLDRARHTIVATGNPHELLKTSTDPFVHNFLSRKIQNTQPSNAELS